MSVEKSKTEIPEKYRSEPLKGSLENNPILQRLRQITITKAAEEGPCKTPQAPATGK